MVLPPPVGDADAPASLKAGRAEWDADHDDLHGYVEMREQLDRHYNERFFVWMPYLYAELANGTRSRNVL